MRISPLILILASVFLGLSAARAQFAEALSPQERQASGIAKLNPAQVAALDRLVAHDVALARSGGVVAFSSNFSSRLSAADREAAGLVLLDAGQVPILDSLVARQIALPPAPDSAFVYAGKPAPAADIELPSKKLQVHGDVSFTVGGGSHGSSFYGTSADVFVTDPTGHLTVGLGFSEFRGRGPWGYWESCDPAYLGP